MTKDEWFDVYRLFHPDADREEFSKEWDETVEDVAGMPPENAGTVTIFPYFPIASHPFLLYNPRHEENKGDGLR